MVIGQRLFLIIIAVIIVAALMYSVSPHVITWFDDLVSSTTSAGSGGASATPHHGFLWIVAAIFFVVTIVALVYKIWWVAVGSGLFLSLALLALTPPSLIEEMRLRGASENSIVRLKASRPKSVLIVRCSPTKDNWSQVVETKPQFGTVGWQWAVTTQYQRNGVWLDHTPGTNVDTEGFRYCDTTGTMVGRRMPLEWLN